jgi:YesN/AraC family two-component response regulator
MASQAWRDKFDRDDDWKAWEITVIKKNWKNKTDRELTKILRRRSEQAIRGKRNELKLLKGHYKFPKSWSTKEEQILRNNYKNYTAEQIANDFLPEKTIKQVKDKAHRLNLSKPKWTKEELDLLVEHGAKYRAGDIVKKFLPNKTIQQICSKRKALNIKRIEYINAQTRQKHREQREQKAVARKEMVAKISNLRKQGLTFVEIGKQMGCSHWYAGQLYNQFKKIYLK